MSDNVIPFNRKPNLDNEIASFLQYLSRADRARTAKLYSGDAKRFAEWLKADPASASPLDIVEYRRYLQERKKPATVNRALVALRVFYDYLCTQGLVPDNPARGIKPVAAVELAPKWLTRAEQAALMRAVRGKGYTRDEAIIGLMLHAGLRVGELVVQAREDIEISERAGTITIRQGKGNKHRQVPLNKTIRKILARWLEVNPDGPLFPNRNGSPISDRGVRKLVGKYAYSARLKDVTPHTLRHTFCKNLLDSGVSIDQVALLAGHSRLEITKIYTVPALQDLQIAVERTSWE